MLLWKPKRAIMCNNMYQVYTCYLGGWTNTLIWRSIIWIYVCNIKWYVCFSWNIALYIWMDLNKNALLSLHVVPWVCISRVGCWSHECRMHECETVLHNQLVWYKFRHSCDTVLHNQLDWYKLMEQHANIMWLLFYT